MHVTLRMAPRTWNLRSERCFRRAQRAFDRTNARGLVSIVHYSVQGNHIHLIVESRDGRSLAGGVKGLAVRLARSLNRLMGVRGRAFGGRYHARELRTAGMVRNALRYVLLNAARHFPGWRGRQDPYSTAAVFDGWSVPPTATWVAGTGPPPVLAPTVSLLTVGWRREGLLDARVVPGGGARPAPWRVR